MAYESDSITPDAFPKAESGTPAVEPSFSTNREELLLQHFHGDRKFYSQASEKTHAEGVYLLQAAALSPTLPAIR